MEEAMKPATVHTPAQAASNGGVLARLRTWWQRRDELDRMDPQELGRIASDVAVSVPELKDMAARGPHAADLLHERMRALGLSKLDVERIAPGLMRDLERTCSCCHEKGVCRNDLATAPDDPAWAGYCPNAEGLTCVRVAKDRLPS
jgi:hypothetical protein